VTRYPVEPLPLDALNTVSLYSRGGKVRTEHFGAASPAVPTPSEWLDSLPRLLAADTLRAVVSALIHARLHQRAIIWGLGGHVIKCGLAPILLDLADRGFVSAFALNGAAAIHDLEFALAGYSSEDVEAVLPDGSFGSAEETGREYNRAFELAVEQGIGAGESLCRHTAALADPRFAAASLLAGAHERCLPVTVHVAVGTDTPHTHPAASGAAIGHATHHDFRLLASLMRQLHDGGVYINLGSAVVLPEVFLKAVSTVRNLGYPLRNFTTVNFDFLQHYRPRVNVVERPHAQAGGKGYSLTGHHEIMIPLLAAILREKAA
jgi:hypothetical protein